MDTSKLELDAQVNAAVAEYLALPSSEEIQKRMTLVDNVDDAVIQILSAERKAWAMRKELAASWSHEVLLSVNKLLKKLVVGSDNEKMRADTILRPLAELLFPNGAFRELAKQTLEKYESDLQDRNLRKDHRISKIQKQAAINTNQHKTQQAMIACVTQFLGWLAAKGEEFSKEAIDRFPKQAGMSLPRAKELLKTLLSAVEKPSVRGSLLELLQCNGFPNASEKAVAICFEMVKNIHAK